MKKLILSLILLSPSLNASTTVSNDEDLFGLSVGVKTPENVRSEKVSTNRNSINIIEEDNSQISSQKLLNLVDIELEKLKKFPTINSNKMKEDFLELKDKIESENLTLSQVKGWIYQIHKDNNPFLSTPLNF